MLNFENILIHSLSHILYISLLRNIGDAEKRKFEDMHAVVHTSNYNINNQYSLIMFNPMDTIILLLLNTYATKNI